MVSSQPIVAPAAEAVPSPTWVRSRTFDTVFIGGTFAVAVAAGLAATVNPRLFVPILVLDLWLLGYHHVISTYSRLGFDRESLREHVGLVTWLPLVVLGGVALVAATAGLWALTSIYLYWQWFHYTRQSWGVARVIERRVGAVESTISWLSGDRLTRAVIYALPAWGILHRSHQRPDEFLTSEVRVIPVPGWLVTIAAAISLITIALWITNSFGAWRRNELPTLHSVYLFTHLAIFGIGYLVLPSIDNGWLAINIWHNAQYVFFVWHFNASRAEKGDSTSFMARLSNPRRVALYMVLSIAATTLIYGAIRSTIATLVAPVIVYQTINFHHYVVDSLIWKVRSKPMTATLGLGQQPSS